MAKNCRAGKRIGPGRQIDLHTPIKSGVSFSGKVDLTKQGASLLKKKKSGRY